MATVQDANSGPISLRAKHQLPRTSRRTVAMIDSFEAREMPRVSIFLIGRN
jgi:hypothetical protein